VGAIWQWRISTKQLGASIDDTVAISIQHEEPIVGLDPTGTDLDAVSVVVKRNSGVSRDRFNPVPVEIDHKRVTTARRHVERLFARPGGGAYLLEALLELSKGIEKREAARRVIVVVAVESEAEFSNLHYTRVLDALKESGAILEVLAIGTPAGSLSDEMRNRNQVLAEGTDLTGGRRDQVLAESGLSDRMEQLADELLNQYVVTYSRPEQLIPPEKLDVSVKKNGLTVRAPKRLPTH